MRMRYGGCLRKVDSERLSALLLEAGFARHERNRFLDAEVTELGSGTNLIATTTDLIYDFGSSPYDFGYVAVAHALSDLYAVLAEPIVATIALGLPPSALGDGSAAEILRGYQQALSDEGVRMGGGHTVFSADAFIGITAVGAEPLAPRPDWTAGGEYVLLLSKPLGSGIYLTAHAHDILSDSQLAASLWPMMRTTNRGAADELRDIINSSGRESLAFVTDVTGFGLLLALGTQLTRGCDAELLSAAIPVLELVEEMIDQHGLATVLGEHSMISVEDDKSFGWSHLSRTMQLILSDPQTSGGLLAAVSRPTAEALQALVPNRWTEIGSVSKAATGQLPTVQVV